MNKNLKSRCDQVTKILENGPDRIGARPNIGIKTIRYMIDCKIIKKIKEPGGYKTSIKKALFELGVEK
jgi:hypothetical protein